MAGAVFEAVHGRRKERGAEGSHRRLPAHARRRPQQARGFDKSEVVGVSTSVWG
ncbi:uncharacterized protein M6B38_342930 [Iris pallida]|uniref:Uncharacterized protein n=1 Tax=Iris pallida TaxID=29817 RepID=A0AAX6GW87_IRIPA|nr:uncharacterized protein M6B38_153525 [Iris pallida]KAJ6833040.1 uncharacterized protein M6B38_342930 [Iris pallida]